MKQSLTLKAKEIKLNRIKNNLKVYDAGWVKILYLHLNQL